MFIPPKETLRFPLVITIDSDRFIDSTIIDAHRRRTAASRLVRASTKLSTRKRDIIDDCWLTAVSLSLSQRVLDIIMGVGYKRTRTV